METKHIQHLYCRAGFGLKPSQMAELRNKSKKYIVSKLFKSSKNYQDLKIDLSQYANIRSAKNYKEFRKKLGREGIKELQRKSRNEVRNLNIAWINRLKKTESVFLEKMTLFWANVFVCRDNNIWNIQNYNNVLRKHALGNFGEFVKAIAREPSMINYLNNKQNKKNSPNENFARELMELFTLGAGHYTEKDIKESARAFTGWKNKLNGEFVLDKSNHDFEEKTFMGKTGNFNGDDIIEIILEQKQCARFICSKIYSYFINPTIDKNRLEELTTLFYKDYNIENLMLYIFESNWFYESQNIGIKIKSPIELLVGIYQTVPYKLIKKNHIMYLQKMMGQILLYPVNVAGWKGGRYWIDSNTMMFRLKLPSVLLNNALINLDEKGDIEETFEIFYKKAKSRKRYLKTEVSWNIFNEEYKDANPKDLRNDLIISKIHPDTELLLSKLKIENNKDYCVQLMSIPEYQLC